MNHKAQKFIIIILVTLLTQTTKAKLYYFITAIGLFITTTLIFPLF